MSCCRTLLRHLVTLGDQAHRAAQAQRRRKQRRQALHAVDDPQLGKRRPWVDAHWDHACRYRRTQGMGKQRRGSHSASGMRLLRRREQKHDGLRSAATRQDDMHISQAIKSLSLDGADFLEQGPHITGLPGV